MARSMNHLMAAKHRGGTITPICLEPADAVAVFTCGRVHACPL
jgi:hypothetical protein